MAVAAPGKEPVDLVRAWTEATGELSGEESPYLISTLHLIEGGPRHWDRVAETAEGASEECSIDLSATTLLAPLDKLASLRDFLAFESHVKKGAERRDGEVPPYWYEAPVYYKGNHRQVIGPDEDCPWPPYTEWLDFELELAMIVGRPGSDIAVEDAGRHVFGFTIMDDFSARDVQMREVTAWLGPAKGKDFATSLGPCIVTADEIGAEPDLEMICRVNGEEWGRGRSGDLHWSWADMIAHVSQAEEIFPGDVYGSGTPGGCCGLDLDRKLEPGDTVELEIPPIGTLRNRVGPR